MLSGCVTAYRPLDGAIEKTRIPAEIPSMSQSVSRSDPGFKVGPSLDHVLGMGTRRPKREKVCFRNYLYFLYCWWRSSYAGSRVVGDKHGRIHYVQYRVASLGHLINLRTESRRVCVPRESVVCISAVNISSIPISVYLLHCNWDD